MCIRDSFPWLQEYQLTKRDNQTDFRPQDAITRGETAKFVSCLLYTSDAADERSSVDLGGRRIIKKKKQTNNNEVREHI